MGAAARRASSRPSPARRDVRAASTRPSRRSSLLGLPSAAAAAASALACACAFSAAASAARAAATASARRCSCASSAARMRAPHSSFCLPSRASASAAAAFSASPAATALATAAAMCGSRVASARLSASSCGVRGARAHRTTGLVAMLIALDANSSACCDSEQWSASGATHTSSAVDPPWASGASRRRVSTLSRHGTCASPLPSAATTLPRHSRLLFIAAASWNLSQLSPLPLFFSRSLPARSTRVRCPSAAHSASLPSFAAASATSRLTLVTLSWSTACDRELCLFMCVSA
mmetsp:Transcript_6087/g.21345  ORF Transcript_6087/g.21345 Transcript_6087/m.21345 type:complete len:292 (-) Transcript_6087:663-1538(-)